MVERLTRWFRPRFDSQPLSLRLDESPVNEVQETHPKNYEESIIGPSETQSEGDKGSREGWGKRYFTQSPMLVVGKLTNPYFAY